MQRWHSLIEWEPEPVRTESSDATTERMLSTASLRASTSSRMDLSGRSSLNSISTSSSFSECVLSSFYVHITIFVTLYLDYISSFFANISEIKPYRNLLSAVTIEKHPINCSKPHNIINSQQSFILMAFWVHSCMGESPIQGVVCKQVSGDNCGASKTGFSPACWTVSVPFVGISPSCPYTAPPLL